MLTSKDKVVQDSVDRMVNDYLASAYSKNLTSIANDIGETFCGCCGSRAGIHEDLAYLYGINISTRKEVPDIHGKERTYNGCKVRVELHDLTEVVEQKFTVALLIQTEYGDGHDNRRKEA